jgi:hypothetical protein
VRVGVVEQLEQCLDVGAEVRVPRAMMALPGWISCKVMGSRYTY